MPYSPSLLSLRTSPSVAATCEHTGLLPGELTELASAGKWLDSPERERAASAAGERQPIGTRERLRIYDPAAIWVWIEALDVIDMRATGVDIKEVSKALGYTNARAAQTAVNKWKHVVAASDEYLEVVASRDAGAKVEVAS